MDPFDVEKCLASMSVLVDTREQPGKRYEQRLDQMGVPYRRQMLSYGDYTYNCILPNGQELFKPNAPVNGSVIIERKMSLEELSGCFCQNRDRFEREFIRARSQQATIYLLVEDASWEKLLNGRYNTKFNPVAFMASMCAWIARYEIRPIMCKHEISGRVIKEILYRELKERIEKGVYDGFR